jgi:hypothetical protein
MRNYSLPLLSLLLVCAVVVLPLAGCGKKTTETTVMPKDAGKPAPGAEEPKATPAAAGEAKWMENPTAADIPDSPIKGMVNGVAFEAKTMRIVKAEKNSKLELMDKAADTPTGMVSDATEVKLEFTLPPGKPGEFTKKMADKDPESTDGWFSYEQKDGTPMTVNTDWAVVLKIDSWTTEKDPKDPKVLGKVKGKIFLSFKDDPKTFVAGTFEGPYCE